MPGTGRVFPVGVGMGMVATGALMVACSACALFNTEFDSAKGAGVSPTAADKHACTSAMD